MKYLSTEDKELLERLNLYKPRELLPAEELIQRVQNFDHTYSYSDDGNVYRTWSEREKVLRKDIEESTVINQEVKALAQSALCNTVDQTLLTTLLDRYPFVKYKHTRANGVIRLMEEFGDEAVEYMIERLRGLYALVLRMPKMSYPGYFVMTPATPLIKDMRAYAKEQGISSCWGVAINPELQREVMEFFSEHGDAKRWQLIAEHNLAGSDSAGVPSMRIAYCQSVNYPRMSKKYSEHSARWISITLPGRHFQFYV